MSKKKLTWAGSTELMKYRQYCSLRAVRSSTMRRVSFRRMYLYLKSKMLYHFQKTRIWSHSQTIKFNCMSEEIKYAYLKTHPLFADLSEQKIVDACSTVKVKTVYRGETLNYGDGNYSKIYLLIKGKIKITECDEIDNELIKDILTAPDVFGDLSLDGHPSLDEFAEALTANTVVCVFNVPDFKRLLQENPLMALSYANMVNSKLKKLEGRHSDLVFRDAKSR